MRILRYLALLLLAMSPMVLQAAEESAEQRQAKLEKAFAEKMTGSVLLGSFTIDGDGDQKLAPQPEKYRIQSVSKIKGETWLFMAGVEYGGKQEIVAPIMLTVKWAGDTPVITLTDVAIPLLGTYSARVLFYGDRYAGVWSGKDHGGELFGRITQGEKEGEAKDGERDASKSDSEEPSNAPKGEDKPRE